MPVSTHDCGHSDTTACGLILDSCAHSNKRHVEGLLQNCARSRDLVRKEFQELFLSYLNSSASRLASIDMSLSHYYKVNVMIFTINFKIFHLSTNFI